MPSDLAISRAAARRPLEEVAADMGIGPHLLEPYGSAASKISLDAIDELRDRPRAKYVVVSAITPTPLGSGKTTTAIGLGQGFRHIDKLGIVAIRQPSMGPVFGIKGGAAGGGYAQVVPMEALNLHLTGDMHAVTAAHNLLSAMIGMAPTFSPASPVVRLHLAVISRCLCRPARRPAPFLRKRRISFCAGRGWPLPQ